MWRISLNFYYIQFFIFLAYSFGFYLIRPNLNKLYYIIVDIQLILIMGLRSYSVGTDTFNNINSYMLNGPIDKDIVIYGILNKFIWRLSAGNYHLFLFVIAVLTVSIFIYCVYQFQSSFIESFLSIYLYITFYFYFDSFNIQRQMLAVSVSMLIPLYLLKGKRIRALLAFLIAMGIHNTVMITAFDFLIYKAKKSKKNLILINILAIIFTFFTNSFVGLLTKISSHYEMYTGNYTYAANGGTLLLGLFVLAFVLVVSFTNNHVYLDESSSTVMYLSCIAAILYIIGARLALMMRMADYFGIFIPLFLPQAIRIIAQRFNNQRFAKFWLCALIMLAGFLIFHYKLSRNIDEIIPYVS